MSKGKTYETLRAEIEHLPVIDTHEHFSGPLGGFSTRGQARRTAGNDSEGADL
jgi:hypothetical protein